MKAITKQLNLQGAEKRQIATHAIADQLTRIMADHIGQSEPIAKSALFQKLFKHPYDHNDLADYLRWEFVKRAMHLLRQRTGCFIVGIGSGQDMLYCVLKHQQDVDVYVNRLDKAIKAMRFMQQRAQKACDRQWWKDQGSWKLPTSMKVLR